LRGGAGGGGEDVDAIVVYESLWGNTAEVARAVAQGLGPGARALRTDEVTPGDVAGAGLIVAGAPVFGFKLSTERMRDGIRKNPGKGPAPDLSCPPLRAWLQELAPGAGWGAAFDTQVRGPFGSGAPEVARLLEAAGYAPLAEPEGFVVKGRHGPLKSGEAERARAWGEQLALEAARRRDA
jgi:flavodoxin